MPRGKKTEAIEGFRRKKLGIYPLLDYRARVSPKSENHLRLEIGHVLFLDIVGYSKVLIEEQKERLRQLTAIVLSTSQVAKSSDEQLVRLPNGDGMALVFHASSEEPAHCARRSPRR